MVLEGSIKPFKVKVDLEKGEINPFNYSKTVKLSELRDFCTYKEDADAILKRGEDPTIYIYLDHVQPETDKDLNFGITVIHPGKIGKEYHFTRGHYHTGDTGEFYLFVKGRGIFLAQNRRREVEYIEVGEWDIIYSPPGWGHRVYNIGEEDLIFITAELANAGHDYESIKREGFAKIVVEVDGSYGVIKRPTPPK
ncbi:MAG: glucose-6-phosphate isomerase family protein [Candidatus Asgardarchaeia archaeon]